MAWSSWSATGALSGPQALSKALRVPPYGTLHPVADGDPATGEKKKGNAVTVTHHVRNASCGYIVTEDIVPGATVPDITHKQLGPMTQEASDAIAFTSVVRMVNAKERQQQFTFFEMSGIGPHT